MNRLWRVILAVWKRARTGDRGERLAASWLERQRGYRIVARNWRNPSDRREEIDLVARDGDILVFIEVKTRAESALVPGYYAVNRRKKRALRSAARAYLQRLEREARTYRLDVVEVSLREASAGEPIVRHFENVPLFPKRVGRR